MVDLLIHRGADVNLKSKPLEQRASDDVHELAIDLGKAITDR